jgi:predicted GIY-YIG superfamily endonuclease
MEMFKGKGSTVEPQKEKDVINMVLVVTTQSKAITQEDLKEKNLKNWKPKWKRRVLAIF